MVLVDEEGLGGGLSGLGAGDFAAAFDLEADGPFSFPQIGDATVSLRFVMSGKAVATGLEMKVFLDGVYVRKGRVAFLIAGANGFTPIDADLLEEIVRKAAAKVPPDL